MMFVKRKIEVIDSNYTTLKVVKLDISSRIKIFSMKFIINLQTAFAV